MKKDRLKEFKNPSNAYRGKPFWSWNGKLEKEELLRQVHVMQEMGFGGYFMHSRTGLETEYLGEEWFDLINACADEGEKLGMESWLYDEDRWPSGTAGGMVTKDPANRMKFMFMEKQAGCTFEWTQQTLAAFIADYDGLTLNAYDRINKQTPKSDYQEKKLLVFTWREMDKSTFYNGYTYLDTLSKEATQTFIQSTHEKYKEKCQERIGTAIKGIFTDEPHRGQMMSTFGSDLSQGNEKEQAVPWTTNFFNAFQETFGYDVSNRLPELFMWYKGEKISPVKWQYIEMLQQLFINHYAKPIDEWCRDNHLILTGHILHEDSLTAQTAMSGSMMRFYEYMEYPGVDVLSEHNKSYWIVKQLASVARQLGKKWMLSELYGCTGWQFSFESHKNVGDWQALFGINLRCQHLSWYTMKGQAKRDYPASILHQSTWWNDYKYVEDYFSRMNVILSKGKPICHTLVLNPVESVWSQVYPGWCNGLDAADEDIKKLEEEYANLFTWLCGAHIDFDYGDEDIMARHISIESNLEGEPILCVGEAKYKQVIVSGMTTIRSTTVDILEEFLAISGKVIFAGGVPEYVDAVPSQKMKVLADNARRIEFNEETVVEACKEKAGNIIEIKQKDGTNNTEIYVQAREEGDCQYIVMLNMNRKKAQNNSQLTFKTNGYIEEWMSTSGERWLLGKGENGVFKYITDICAGGERIFVITNKKDETLANKADFKTVKQRHMMDKSYQYTLDEENVCVLDIASYNIDNQGWKAPEDILKIDQKVRDYFALGHRGGEMLQPWFVNQKGFQDKGIVTLAYEFSVDVLPKGNIYLVVEDPEKLKIEMNDQTIDTSKQDGWWIDRCFKKINIPNEKLVKGKNKITLETMFNERTDLEAIYLLGNFGVSLDGFTPTIDALSETLAIGDITTQGLPFYSGKVTYKMMIDLQPEKDERVFLQFNEFEGACIKVKGEDGTEQMVAWQPYEAEITEALKVGKSINVEVVLTRRNTFGPLHLVPKRALAYGPAHFTSEGDAYSMDYQLIEAGLLEQPDIVIKTKA